MTGPHRVWISHARSSARRFTVVCALGAAAVLTVVPSASAAAGGHGRPTYTEDTDTNDDTPNNVVDHGDDAHPSGRDRSVEHGRSGNQGHAHADPDDDGRGPDRSNGGADQPDGPGGVDLADQDGNNGCGNDDDFEDDDEGYCGRARTAARWEPSGGHGPDEHNPPCDGCVGRADDRVPDRQANPADTDRGQECDGNHGIGPGNPAHIGCRPPALPTGTAPPADPSDPGIVGTNPPIGIPLDPATVAVNAPAGNLPTAVHGAGVVSGDGPRAAVLGTGIGFLPRTGMGLIALAASGAGLIGTGSLAVAWRRRRSA